jgi:hypothetical protein
VALAPVARAARAPRRRPLADFADLRRHLVFEYYPWYANDPWRHWDEAGHRPPDDLASNYVPRLGAYDSRSLPVMEQHARWIADSGAGAVNVSWWGRDSFEDRAVHALMDVMRDHDLKVAFHLEPYAADRGRRYVDDVLYLLREYGEKRRYDALLLLEDADGRSGPVFKGFAMILPATGTDCHGVTRPEELYTPDDLWARANERLRSVLRGEFDHVTLLADTLDLGRALRGGFDGVAIYDNFVPPSDYAAYARLASDVGLLFSFNVNAGFDAAERRDVESGSCYAPPPFAPRAPEVDWSSASERERAAALGLQRIDDSLEATLRVQTDPALRNATRGFLLVYVCTFNEWHEGTAFEPMKDAADLAAGERARGYHNPARGDARLALLRDRLLSLSAPARAAVAAR